MALILAGVPFILDPAARPWADQSSTTDGFLKATESGWWVTAHLFSVYGFILVSLGAMAISDLVRDTG